MPLVTYELCAPFLEAKDLLPTLCIVFASNPVYLWGMVVYMCCAPYLAHSQGIPVNFLRHNLQCL